MKFTSAWANRCGKPLNTSICADVINPARGRGAALTYANCVAGALADRRLADAGEFACILEDDARPFSTDWCDASEREAIVRQMPSEALLLLIGGHDMEAQPGYSRAPVTSSTSRPYKFGRLSKTPNSMDPMHSAIEARMRRWYTTLSEIFSTSAAQIHHVERSIPRRQCHLKKCFSGTQSGWAAQSGQSSHFLSRTIPSRTQTHGPPRPWAGWKSYRPGSNGPSVGT